MSMRILYLRTYWNASDAHVALELIDALREQILESYGDDIADMLEEAGAGAYECDPQLEFPFEDDPSLF